MLQLLNGWWIKAAGIAVAVLAVAGSLFKAGKDSQRVQQHKQEDKVHADETKVRNDVGALSGSAARDRLRDKWSKR